MTKEKKEFPPYSPENDCPECGEDDVLDRWGALLASRTVQRTCNACQHVWQEKYPQE